MSLSQDRSTASRLQKEIGDLRTKEATEAKKEADATRKANAAVASAGRSSSAGIVKMHLAAAGRETKAAEAAQQRRARLAGDIARKSRELANVQDRIAKVEESERRAQASADAKRQRQDEQARAKLTAANDRLRTDYEARVANLEAQLAAQIEAQAASVAPFQVGAAEGEAEPYDFFLSHSSADKEDFVDGFAAKARAAGLRVWYDGFTMEWGDSIRDKIDAGLRSAYFGVVVLSPSFFVRPWPNYELDGILQRDLSGHGRLLPIWHRLTQDDVAKHAPSLAGRLALSTASSSSDAIVAELIVVRDRFKHALDREAP